ncbi:MAG: hydroxymethylbilane synthase [Thermodesulfobacteriota bacterium]
MTRTWIVIGTRGSALALAQAHWVRDRLRERHPELEVRLALIKTKGDKIQDVPLAKVGGKGLFVKEIEDALLDGRVDLAVHSLKDVPAELPAGLAIDCLPEREDFRDSLVTPLGLDLESLPAAARVGTSSLRRQAQILHSRPDLTVMTLRGNLDTRLKKLAAGGFEAVVVAEAGLKRMNFNQVARRPFEPEVLLPAVGQGALGLETRRDDDWLGQKIAFLHHQPTAWCVSAERAFLVRMQGGCQVPLAALGRILGRSLKLDGLVASPDGRRFYRASMEAPLEEAETLGQRLADHLLDRGGREILAEVYKNASGQTD